MISRRIRILALTLFTCLAFLSFGVAQHSTLTSIHSSGTIGTIEYSSYVCGNYNSTHYYAQNNVTRNYELISTSATQTISYALSQLTAGRTWRETILLKGTFSIDTTITVRQASVLLDCRQATLTSTANTLLSVRSSNVNVLGGHWIGQAGCTTAIQLGGSSAKNCVIDGLEIENFDGGLDGAICGAYASSYNTIQNCLIHDNSENYCINFGADFGHNKVINCKIHNSRAGIFICQSSGYNQIIECEFFGNNGHSIYNDGGATALGHNIVTGCKFHNQLSGAGFNMKTSWNRVYNNTFYDFNAAGAPAFSIYSELTNYYANDNEIYNNTFTDILEAFWVGHDPAWYPTLRNKIYDNTFTRVTHCIRLNPWIGAVNTVEDTWIYYNKFASCGDIFPTTGDDAALVVDTVIAYNDFGGMVTNLSIETYNNTMVYGNVGMDDFNVPSPLPIPPPA